MEQVEPTRLLDGLIATWGSEIVEFKQANLRRKGRICNTGSGGHPAWKLAERKRAPAYT